MEIADGEYDIDLLALLHDPQTTQGSPSLVAIRYGFIPDSMDQKAALRLYQNDQVCVLEAQLVDKAAKSGVKAQPIIFEGVPQGQRLGQASATADTYFLLFLPNAGGGKQTMELRRLENVIRVSKLRNTDKWRTAIAEWKDSSTTSSSSLRKAETPTTAARQGSGIPSRTSVSKPRAKAAAMKRPPTAEKNEIISVSDFEDLDSSSEEDAFPVFDSAADNAKSTVTKKTEVAKNPKSIAVPDFGQSHSRLPQSLDTTARTKSAASNTIRPSQPSRAKELNPRAETEDIELDDEFKDLEDELEEVMEKQGDFNMSDSDDNSDFRPRSAPILIKVSDNAPSRPSSTLGTSRDGRKPISLRELYDSNKGEDVSSSEEE